ncbi:hypothetical protein ACIA8K_12655 [Catenuloplanes sp. NPDC051500]|uniref:hypothetical protein n=1 Tax=Catenuloplanes sp. NPDC051500 TaxID=3363959 RepID=UPI00378D5E21
MKWTVEERWLNGHLANMPGVQGYLGGLAFGMFAAAEENLVRAHLDRDDARGDSSGHASIRLERGDNEYGHVDWYVVLDDTRGLHAALSIEYGHGSYKRRIYNKEFGYSYTITVPASRPTYILTNATRIPRKGKKVSGSAAKKARG